MATLTENLIAYLNGYGDLNKFHIGEVVPQEIATDYVYISQTQEVEGEALDERSAEMVSFDCEIVAGDLVECRNYVNQLKTALRSLAAWSASFEGLVEAIIVDDHGDDYVFKTADPEDRQHVSAVLITVLL